MPKKSKAKRSRSARDRSDSTGPPSDQPQRLQKLLASAGFGSRRQCEELIEAGRVTIDGQTVTKLGTTVDPSTDKVHVDGTLVKRSKLVYYAVNKPFGFVTTNRDPHGRPRVVDLVPPDDRVFPVGRLDRNSEGLILLTNDGELAQRLTHPKFGVRKVYRVTVAGKVDGETMKQMREGIYIAEGFVKVEGAKLLKSRSRSTEMEIVLREGKNREIRRILARLGHKVQHLRRIAVGPLRLGDVPSGAYRVLKREEVKKLWSATDPAAPSSSSRQSPPRKRAAKKRKATGRVNTGRRPAKKMSAQSSTESYGDSRKTGAVIGGDPAPRSTSKPPKKAAKKRAAKKVTKKSNPGRKRKR